MYPNNCKQFTRNAQGFYLQCQLHPQAISFLLASNNQDEFYQLRLTEVPAPIKRVLPTIEHLFVYLLKNHKHPKAFRIDAFAKIYVTVPTGVHPPVQIVLPANRITRDSIMPEDYLMQEEQIDVQEVKIVNKTQVASESASPYFAKKKKRGSETYCLDLEEDTPRSNGSGLSATLSPPQEQEWQRNLKICQQAEKLLNLGLQMRQVKHKLRLSDRTAWKMYQQYIKYHRIFTPEQTTLMRKTQKGKELLSTLRQQNPQASPQVLQSLLQSHGASLSIDYISRWLQQNLKNLIYYEESQSMVCSGISQ